MHCGGVCVGYRRCSACVWARWGCRWATVAGGAAGPTTWRATSSGFPVCRARAPGCCRVRRCRARAACCWPCWATNSASPSVVGVNAGAGLAVTVCCARGGAFGLGGGAVRSFGGALLAVGRVVLLARRTGASRTTVAFAGVALNSILGAFREARDVAGARGRDAQQ